MRPLQNARPRLGRSRTVASCSDRATFDFSEGLPPIATRRALTTAVAEWWPRWPAEPSGRTALTTADAAFATAWRSTADGTIVAAGYDNAASVATTAEEARRHLLLAGFALVALILVGAGYVVFRALQRELNVARLQSEFVAQVSHEFRTPLTAMRHLTELLEEDAAPPGRLAGFHQALGKETRRLHAMVEGLLDFGRIESGRQVYKPGGHESGGSRRASRQCVRFAAAAPDRQRTLAPQPDPLRCR